MKVGNYIDDHQGNTFEIKKVNDGTLNVMSVVTKYEYADVPLSEFVLPDKEN